MPFGYLVVRQGRRPEERRIAYVAMTRTQGDLIVCVSGESYKRLLASVRCLSQASTVARG